jgi:UTP--glucose-1-phosphate uridylyltransferase
MFPATQAIPKEMLPIASVPIIRYIVEEIKYAGFKEIIFITNSKKFSVENYVNYSFELEAILEKRTKKPLFKEAKNISKLGISIQSVRQEDAKGLGHAVYAAKDLICDEPFAVVLPDMLIQSSKHANNLALMKKDFEKNNTSSILLGEVQKKDISKYGITKIKEEKIPGPRIIESMIEKPSLKNAPSNLFAVGRYIFTNEIIKILSKIKPDKNNEIQLTDAIDNFLRENGKIYGYKLDGKIHDCGNKLGYLIANIEYSKSDPEIGRALKSYLRGNEKINK